MIPKRILFLSLTFPKIPILRGVWPLITPRSSMQASRSCTWWNPGPGFPLTNSGYPWTFTNSQ